MREHTRDDSRGSMRRRKTTTFARRQLIQANEELHESDLEKTMIDPEMATSTRLSRFLLQLDCPNGELTKKKFIQVYRQFFPNGQAEAFCTHIFRTFDADNSGKIDFK